MICWRARGLLGEVREYRLGPVSLRVVSRADLRSSSHLLTCARILAVFASTTPSLLPCFWGVGTLWPRTVCSCILPACDGPNRSRRGEGCSDRS